MNLRDLQEEHRPWLQHNFPEAKPHEPLLGIQEEVGELAHAHLKYEQGIRGYTRSKFQDEAEDAIGDQLIYLASYCNLNFLDLQTCMERTWEKVKQRDWIADPEKGGQ